MFDTPILFIVFNRPDETREVFQSIRGVRPAQLFIAADGPRLRRDDDQVNCAAVKDIVSKVDWPCEVHTLFREENLGCGVAVSEAISWFFEHVDEGIILEDDCLPHPTFFPYCKTLLERYRNDVRIMSVSGNNFQNGIKRGDGSYYFSKYPHIWGWATWKRAWSKYDFKLDGWEEFQKIGLSQVTGGNQEEISVWSAIATKLRSGEIDTWDYQWTLSCWLANGLHVLPCRNLVSNIGFGENATHTKGESRFSRMKTYPYVFPDRSPSIIENHIEADRYTFSTIFLPTLSHLTAAQKPTAQSPLKWLSRLLPYSIKDRIVTYILNRYVPPRPVVKEEFPSLQKDVRYQKQTISLFGRNFQLTDSASFLSIYREVFKDEIYGFTCENDRPYIIDAGANIGLSIIYFKQQHPDAEVIAFEADKDTYDVLKANVASFELQQVTLFNKAVWDSETTLRFFSEGADGGRVAISSDVNQITEVDAVRLRPYLERKVDLLKIDIEGAEVRVLEDCSDLLSNVERLFVEYHSFAGQEQQLHCLLSLLTSAGFRYYISQVGTRSQHPLNGFAANLGIDNQLNIFAIKN